MMVLHMPCDDRQIRAELAMFRLTGSPLRKNPPPPPRPTPFVPACLTTEKRSTQPSGVTTFLQAFQQLQRTFFAFMLTVTVHFILGVRPILLLQLFSTPFNFVENRLFRKHVLGLQPGYRVWGERFDGEVDPSQIVEAEGEVATEGGDAVVVGTPVEAVDCAVLEVTAKVVQGEGREVTAAVAQADAEGLPMPKKLEDALIDAWDAAENADWSAVSAHVGPLSVNTQTPTGRWTPLMVACGLPKVCVCVCVCRTIVYALFVLP